MDFGIFQNTVRADEAKQINRTTAARDWFYKDEEILHERFSNRTCPSIAPLGQRVAVALKKPRFSYWASVVYTDKTLADKDAVQYGGHVEECFYCDPDSPTWFMIFDDFDKALQYAYDKLKEFGKL